MGGGGERMILIGDHIFQADNDTMQFADGKSFFSAPVQETGFFEGFFPVDPYIGVQMPAVLYFL